MMTKGWTTWAPWLLGALVAGCSSSFSAASPDGGTTPGAGDNGGGTDASAGGSSPDGSTSPGHDGGSTHPTDASTPGHDASAPTLAGATNVQILTEPNGNGGSEVVAAIKAAKKSVHMTMYLLDDPNVIQALVDQKNAGLDVKVVLNQVFPSGTTSQNPQTYSTLQSAGVGVVWANSTRFTYTHEKTVILDGATVWIMTMNLEKSSPSSNREYLVIDNEAADAAEADTIFAADYANSAITATGSLVVAPQPPNDARQVIVALINSAKTNLDIEAEEFSDFGSQGGGVVPQVAAAAQRGVKVRLVLAQGTNTTQAQAVAQVKAAGVSVVVTGASSGSGSASNPYIHAKVMLADCGGGTCAAGYIGSENFTGGSLGYNRELGVLVKNGSALGPVEATIDADFKAGTPQ